MPNHAKDHPIPIQSLPFVTLFHFFQFSLRYLTSSYVTYNHLFYIDFVFPKLHIYNYVYNIYTNCLH